MISYLFLNTFDDLLPSYKISLCPITNRIHTDEIINGNDINKVANCCILEENTTGIKWHAFMSLPISPMTNGESICQFFEKDRYIIKHYVQHTDKIVLTKLANSNEAFYLRSLEDLTKTRHVLKYFISAQLNYYKTNIYEKIKPYHMCAYQLFDIFNGEQDVNSNNIMSIFFRPISIVVDPPIFYDQKRKAIFELIRLYANSNECTNNVLYNNMKNTKDRLYCSAMYFIQGRSIAPELSCSYTSMDSCQHIIEMDALTLNGLSRPKNLCRHVLEKLISQKDDALVSNMLDFKCIFRQMDEINEKLNNTSTKRPSILNAFNGIYGRKTTIHRVCLPTRLLTSAWNKWLDGLFEI